VRRPTDQLDTTTTGGLTERGGEYLTIDRVRQSVWAAEGGRGHGEMEQSPPKAKFSTCTVLMKNISILTD